MTVSYPRRQQVRRLRHAAVRAMQAAGALAAALIFAPTGGAVVVLVLVLLAVALGASGLHALRTAARSSIGAQSEAQVRRVLERLVGEGWRVRHAVDWPAVGDLDHVVRAPTGVGFVIETKTLRYTRAHLWRTAEAARWLAPRRRRYAGGVRPVVCVVRSRSVEQVECGVLVVSLDRLLAALRACGQRSGHAMHCTSTAPSHARPPRGWPLSTEPRRKRMAAMK